MSAILSREAILAAPDLVSEDVPVPEWGGTVRVRAMNGVDRDSYEQSMVTQDATGKRQADLRNMRAKLVAMTLVDEAGDRMFGVDEVALLGTKSAAALDRVFIVAQRLNGLGGESVEATAKNSDAAPSGASTSDLPATSE